MICFVGSALLLLKGEEEVVRWPNKGNTFDPDPRLKSLYTAGRGDVVEVLVSIARTVGARVFPDVTIGAIVFIERGFADRIFPS